MPRLQRLQRLQRLLRPLALVLTIAGAFAPRASWAEDRISVQGAYFREASNRIVQPMMEATKDLPQGFDVGGHFLVDAISSASIAQGALVDEVFQENRYEGSISAGRTNDRFLRIGGFLRYSTEPDYKSHTAGVSVSQEFWERTGTLNLNVAFTHDDIEPPPPQSPKDLDQLFVGLAYTQALSPTTNAQLVYETFYQRGFIANVYIAHPNLGREKVPGRRLRHAWAGRIAQYVPQAELAFQLHYRFYFDQEGPFNTGAWGMRAHTVETRLYKELGRDFELRLAYRYHRQFGGNFYCNARPDNRGDVGCYGMMPTYHSFDPKFGDLDTDLVELRFTWDTRVLAGTSLDLFSPGAFNISYGYYFQNSPYGQPFTDRNAPPLLGEIPFTRSHGGAHLIQTGYSLPF
jgi:hypothetical protein